MCKVLVIKYDVTVDTLAKGVELAIMAMSFINCNIFSRRVKSKSTSSE